MQDSMGKLYSILVVLGAILLLRTIMLVQLGPIFTPDSYGYSQIADYLLGNTEWLRYERLGWGEWGEPQTIFRILGYPMILALAKLASPDGWAWLVILFQSAISFITTFFVYRLAIALSKNHAAALFVVFSHSTGHALLFDQCVLSDSLNASFLIVLVCQAGIAIVDKRKPSYAEAICLGVLVAVAFFMREAGSVFQFLYWPLVIYWGLLTMGSKLRAVLLLICFASPMAISTEGYKAWNQYRTGERFITAGNSTAIFFPAVYLYTKGVPVFDNDPLLKDMGPLINDPSNVTVIRGSIFPHLLENHAFNFLDISRYAESTYKRLWIDFPKDMTLQTLSMIKESQAFQAIMPLESMDRGKRWVTSKSSFPAKGELWTNLREGRRFDHAVLVAVRSLMRMISVAITATFIVGVPWLMIMEIRAVGWDVRAHDSKVLFMTLIWIIYFGYTMVYASIHLEMRYLLPVVPLSLVAGVSLLVDMGRRFLPQRWLAEVR